MYMFRTLMVYDSKYGSTEEVARKLALVLGPAGCIRPDEFKEEYKDQFDFIVLLVPVYNEKLYPSMLAFAEKHQVWLMGKHTAVISCALATGKHALHYLAPMAGILGESCVCQGAVGGRLNLKQLDAGDLKIIRSFYEGLGQEAKDADRFDLGQFLELAFQLKVCVEGLFPKLPAGEVRAAVEDFLNGHNTCTLSTGRGGFIRGTPIEYRYQDGYVYFLTEGGEKFAGILQNRQASIAVYDSYKGAGTVAGLQLAGEVTEIITNPLDAAYRKVCALWKINPQKIAAKPYALNGLVVKIREAEFFWAGFDKAGGYVKQFYRF